MANHARRQIRDLIFARLAGLPTSGPHIYKTRVFQMNNNTLPGLIVWTGDDDSEDVSIGFPRLQRHQLEVRIECYAKASSNVEDVLDDMCKEIELALTADISLGNKVRDIKLISTHSDFDDADKAIGVAKQRWFVTYMVRENAPDVLI